MLANGTIKHFGIVQFPDPKGNFYKTANKYIAAIDLQANTMHMRCLLILKNWIIFISIGHFGLKLVANSLGQLFKKMTTNKLIKLITNVFHIFFTTKVKTYSLYYNLTLKLGQWQPHRPPLLGAISCLCGAKDPLAM